MNCEIQFIQEAVNDYRSLDGSIKKLVNEKIDKLKENPFLGKALGNKNNIDLTGYYNYSINFFKYSISLSITYLGKIFPII